MSWVSIFLQNPRSAHFCNRNGSVEVDKLFQNVPRIATECQSLGSTDDPTFPISNDHFRFLQRFIDDNFISPCNVNGRLKRRETKMAVNRGAGIGATWFFVGEKYHAEGDKLALPI